MGYLTTIEFVASEIPDIYRAELFLDSTMYIPINDWYNMKAVRSSEAEGASYHNICVSKARRK